VTTEDLEAAIAAGDRVRVKTSGVHFNGPLPMIVERWAESYRPGAYVWVGVPVALVGDMGPTWPRVDGEQEPEPAHVRLLEDVSGQTIYIHVADIVDWRALPEPVA
jgi:hypothetical protein